MDYYNPTAPITTAVQGNDWLDWDTTTFAAGNDFVLLPEGDYGFTILKTERERCQDGAPKLTLTLDVDGGELGHVQLKDGIKWVGSMQWKIASVLEAVGAERDGEGNVTGSVEACVGMMGAAHVGVRKWIGKDGKERESNQVERYIPMPLKAHPVMTPAQGIPGAAF